MLPQVQWKHASLPLITWLSANRNIININKPADNIINNASVDGISTMLQFILCFALCNRRFNADRKQLACSAGVFFGRANVLLAKGPHPKGY